METKPMEPMSMEQRVSRLERENRHLRRQCRWLQVIAVAIGSVILLVGASNWDTVNPTFEEVTVERLTIKGDEGKTLGTIGTDTQGGIALHLLDSKGIERIRLAVEHDGTARQRLFDDEGNVRVSSSTFPSDHATAAGSAGQVIYDKLGNKRIRTATSADGLAMQQFNDKDGNTYVETVVSPDGFVRQSGLSTDGREPR